MEQSKAYNQTLYLKRQEANLSRRKFAKYLNIPSFFYFFFEKGYVRPSEKTGRKIAEKLELNYESTFEGLASFPFPNEVDEDLPFLVKMASKTFVRILFLILTLLSLAGGILGYSFSNYYKTHARDFYSERYLSFVDKVREVGKDSYSLFHELDRPCISINEENLYRSIVVSKSDEAIRTINAYVDFKEKNNSLLFYFSENTQSYLTQVKVEYTDFSSGTVYDGVYEKGEDGNYHLPSLTGKDETYSEGDEIFDSLSLYMNSKLSSLDEILTDLVKQRTSLPFDFFNDILKDHAIGAKKNVRVEILSLSFGVGGVVLSGVFLFCFIYCFLLGKNKKDTLLFENENNQNAPITKTLKPIKSDTRFFPFIPENVFEIVGILLTFFGSLRVLYYLTTFFNASRLNPNEFENVPNMLFLFFTIGMFLLYFMDFDIFLEDKRVTRNIFLYGIVFFAVYFIEATMVEYFSRTRGVVNFLLNRYTIPNNFGTICCYFMMMFFLFMTPKWADSKKKIVFFRCLVILPILWVITSSILFLYHKNFGLEFNTWQLYFFNSERPQFSLLCILYLLGLYFLRLYFEKKYTKEVAKRFFHSNRFYFYKNILICAIILLLSICEFCLRKADIGNIKSIGRYWQIIYLVPFLLFYHPHLGKRNKVVDYLTLGMYFLFFGVGYVVVGLLAFVFVLSL